MRTLVFNNNPSNRVLNLFLSLRFSGHFSRWTWVTQYQNVSFLDFTGAKDDGGGGDNWRYKTCKAPVKSSSLTTQHPAFDRPDALPVTQPTASKHWREKKQSSRSTCVNLFEMKYSSKWLAVIKSSPDWSCDNTVSEIKFLTYTANSKILWVKSEVFVKERMVLSEQLYRTALDSYCSSITGTPRMLPEIRFTH